MPHEDQGSIIQTYQSFGEIKKERVGEKELGLVNEGAAANAGVAGYLFSLGISEREKEGEKQKYFWEGGRLV